MNKLYVVLTAVLFLNGCAFYKDKCEDTGLSKDKVDVCFDLQKEITNIKDITEDRTKLEQRYQNECTSHDVIKASDNICSSED